MIPKLLTREGSRSNISRAQLEEWGFKWEEAKKAKFIVIPTGKDEVSVYRVEQAMYDQLTVTPLVGPLPKKEEMK